MHELLWVIVVAIVIVYVGAPLLILFVQKFNAPSLQPYDPTALPPQVQQYFLGAIGGMMADGFTVIAYCSMPGLMSNLTPVFVYLANYQSGDKAMVACIWVAGETGFQVRNPYSEFSTRFADGTAVVSSNSTVVGATKYPDTRRIRRFRSVQDVRMLYRLHRYCLERDATGKTAVLPPQGQELAFVTQAMVDDFEYQVKCGLMRSIPATGGYAASPYGAYYLTWAELFPAKQIRLALVDREAAKVIADFRRSSATS